PQVTFATNEQSRDTTIALTIDGEVKEHITQEEISLFTQEIPFLIYDPSYVSEIENNLMCLNKFQPCLLTSTVQQSFTIKNQTYPTVATNAIRSFVEDVARKTNIDPSNARLQFNTDTNEVEEMTPHTDGIAIDVEKTTTTIVDYLQNNHTPQQASLEMSYAPAAAEVTSDNAVQLGITELIGTGTSNFSGSTKSRIHNITTASKRFDGIVIAPDEEFSFVSILGPVDGEHGYKEELVIRDNETKPEYGGGICQVSTTVFRGAIYTGMKITQRRNHSYPVHYYTPTGFDATVYVPAPDFRFVNNTPGHILLNTEMKGTKLIFNYYGTSDGRNVVMDGPHVTDRQSNGAMKTYFTQTVTTKNGDTLIDDTFKSNYKSPDDYPHPGDVAKLTNKPKNWSKREWNDYKKENGL
ncbi:MAG: VanW family protein, partial [Patescibacteria group bacterium]|nr:VanW family protein [Patescibacteria group bacterium]